MSLYVCVPKRPLAACQSEFMLLALSFHIYVQQKNFSLSLSFSLFLIINGFVRQKALFVLSTKLQEAQAKLFQRLKLN